MISAAQSWAFRTIATASYGSARMVHQRTHRIKDVRVAAGGSWKWAEHRAVSNASGRCSGAGAGATSEGNALVEAVIVVPLLMLLTFGSIEFGLGFSQRGGLESVSRAGARRAATLTDVADNAQANEIGLETADAVNAALGTTSLPAEMNSLYVYKVTAGGTASGGDGGCTDTSSCIEFAYDTALRKFVYVDGSWPIDNRDACLANPDRVGVSIVGYFHFLTRLIGVDPIKLHPTSVLQLEPTNCND